MARKPPTPAPEAATAPFQLVSLPRAEVPPFTNHPAVDDFEPTREQQNLRTCAVDCIAAGMVHPVQWLDDHRNKFGITITAAQFNRWKRSPRFVRWFYTDLVYQPDREDQDIVDAVFRQKLAEGVMIGDPKAMELYAVVRGFRQRPKGDAAPANEAEEILRDFAREPASAAGWGGREQKA